MNCWDVLGIEPTRNRASIDEAYQQQAKFVSSDDSARLDEAYRDALVEAGYEAPTPAPRQDEQHQQPAPQQAPERQTAPVALSTREQQVVREVVIQIEALLNDDGRRNDPDIWGAILTEPPAEDAPIKGAIADSLEPRVRPMARNGQLAAPVAHALGNWFGWPELAGASATPTVPDIQPGGAQSESPTDQELDKPQLINFWPAVIGWIAALVILTMLFGGMGGGG
ncbi:hypothetical protein [Marinobacter sp. X15-166B]|uniref:hypothetical protein n=1 Tax=Marinobacter sp. X15-166B TaxID=1897620 RepID=UPI00085C192F|nr:hypothetical protein [Marinobacter sp. X15-166B]OEY68095.1 hypothetical protein BG841_14665 [Marinobacter sp. X15-166B]